MSTRIKVGIATSIFLILGVGFYAYPKYKMINFSQHLFDQDQIVENFRSFDQVWPTKQIFYCLRINTDIQKKLKIY